MLATSFPECTKLYNWRSKALAALISFDLSQDVALNRMVFV